MNPSLSFTFSGHLYELVGGYYRVNGVQTTARTYREARDSMAHGPRSAESIQLFDRAKHAKKAA